MSDVMIVGGEEEESPKKEYTKYVCRIRFN